MKKLETSFFLNRIYFSTRKCMFPTFSKNLPRDYTAALTIYSRVMIFTNFVELHCLMLLAKFQNHRPSGLGDF